MIGLRNKMEGPTAMEAAAGVEGDAAWTLPAPDVSVRAEIISPDHRAVWSRTARLLIQPPTSWIYLTYPSDFAGAPGRIPGNYTIIWISDGGTLACDGFNKQ